jgi:iron(III) transport system ATP-binding protein
MSTSITISGIAKSFPALPGAPGTVDGKTIVLHSIDLAIESGELFFLLGPSGCGKTTLLRIIAGFIEPDSGTLSFNGRDVTFAPANTRNTGMVFQSYALWPHMTVAENVAFGLDIRKIAKPEQTRRVREALELVRMAHLEMRRPVQLSGGQQQRVALARAMVIRPDVLLLDEPLSNLDAKLRIELRSEIRRICKSSGITTVYVTHDQKEALSMADRVAIMHQGRLEQVGTPEMLYRRPRTAFVASFLGETNFLPATMIEATSGLSRFRSVAGEVLVGDISDAAAAPAPGSSATLSIRPESLTLHPQQGPDVFHLSGTLADTTYLGELAQHTITLADQSRVHVAEFNPGFLARRAPGAPITLFGRAADVVALPPESP